MMLPVSPPSSHSLMHLDRNPTEHAEHVPECSDPPTSDLIAV